VAITSVYIHCHICGKEEIPRSQKSAGEGQTKAQQESSRAYCPNYSPTNENTSVLGCNVLPTPRRGIGQIKTMIVQPLQQSKLLTVRESIQHRAGITNGVDPTCYRCHFHSNWDDANYSGRHHPISECAAERRFGRGAFQCRWEVVSMNHNRRLSSTSGDRKTASPRGYH